MATRKDIREDIRGLYGSMLTVSQIGQYLGVDQRTAKKYIEEHDLMPVRVCGREKYSVIDFAKAVSI